MLVRRHPINRRTFHRRQRISPDDRREEPPKAMRICRAFVAVRRPCPPLIDSNRPYPTSSPSPQTVRHICRAWRGRDAHPRRKRRFNHFPTPIWTPPTATQPRLNHPSDRIQERFRHNHPKSVILQNKPPHNHEPTNWRKIVRSESIASKV